MFHKRCFVYLCYDFPIIDILCFTRLFCVSVLCSPYNWYFMYHKRCFVFVFCFPYYWYLMSHKRCFVYLCYDFPIIGILCFTSVVLYISVMISPSLIFYVSQGCFVYLCYALPIIVILCITSVVLYLCSAFPIIGIFCLTSVVLYICIMISL
jgi:hypothetical protein